MDRQDFGVGIVMECGPSKTAEVLAIINAAAEAYRGVIPSDRWHEPYMSTYQLASELADGVVFSGYVVEDGLVGVMGVQRRYNVDLIRHAYVRPEWQGRGVGARLLQHLCREAERPILIGTWTAAEWAVRFYERHGFVRVDGDDVASLLQTYWNVPDQQIAASVVLACPSLTSDAASQLIAAAHAAGR